MGNKLLILQAGPMQVPVIKTAKEMGLKVIATDRNVKAEGFHYADVGVPIDVVNMEDTLKLAREYNIAGVLPCGDVSVPTAAFVSEALGLPGLNPGVAQVATDKSLLLEKFYQSDVPCPDFEVASDVDELEDAEDLGLPVIVKPAMSFGGSRGVKRINRFNDLEAGFWFAHKFSRNGKVVFEEFLDGTEHTVESLTFEGETNVLAISDKMRLTDPFCVATSLNYPSQFPDSIQEKIKETVKKAVKAVGIPGGATHIEVITANDEAKIIDFGARGGAAGFIPAVIVPHVAGVSMMKDMIRMALGMHPFYLWPRKNRGAVFRFFTAPPGKIMQITGVEDAKEMEGVASFGLNVKVGDMVPPLTNQLERIGYFVVFAEDNVSAIERAYQIEQMVEFHVKNY